MKETSVKHTEFDPETHTNPILEECYRIKAEISAQFKTLEDYYVYLKKKEEKEKRNGIKYISYKDVPKHDSTDQSEESC